ncbi:MAG: protein-L-isoaspartate(D-aspartate) O-methyltransferase [Candidatus Omnitrophica bacterium]|nr:protein-L-isoaspartate(D-aspartate) O-methyltransferase [Candidatus Omnitrophota bacterium]
MMLLLSAGCYRNGDDMYTVKRDIMLREQIEKRGVRDERVLKVIGKVPRHLFVPEEIRDKSYEDYPLPIGENQTISQPYIVALMTELLSLKGGEKVLEIGTGSGYQAAILAELSREVYSVEIIDSLARKSEKLLRSLGYKNVFILSGDGYLGWREHSPYDSIIVTCAPEAIPQDLIDQLKEGGRMVIPVGSMYQDLKVVVKSGGKVKISDNIPVRFVPMVRDR